MAAVVVYATLWRALFGRPRPGSVIGPVAHLILHHEYGRPLPASSSLAQERARLKAIDAYHRSRGWQGFGYSVMGCASGRVHEGRGYRRSGAHTGHMNRTALAALLPGTDTGMTPAQVAGLRGWQTNGIRDGAILPHAVWTGHRDHMDGRDCPGDTNYAQLHELNAPEPAPAPVLEDDMAKLSDEAQEFWEDAFRELQSIDASDGGPARPSSLMWLLLWGRGMRRVFSRPS